MSREDYTGQIFGTREIIKNSCVDEDWLKIGREIPTDKTKYRLGKCLNCGEIMPVLIPQLRRNPPKRCCYCSGINCKGTNKRNTWGKNCVNILYKDSIVTAYLSEEDIEEAKKHVWRISKKKNKFYVITGSRDNQIYLHQLVIKEKPKKGYEIDHIDGNSLNNRRENLRVVTRLENIQNVQVRIDNQIGIRGICQTKSHKYQVDFAFNKKRYRFPYFNTLTEAVYCRKYAEEYFNLSIIEKNPLAQKFFTLSDEEAEKIKKLVLSIIK